jgi:hypothetical protein
MPPVALGPRCNRQVTCSPDPHNDRSESALAVNPTDSYNMVGSSKKFTDPLSYLFSLAAYYTFDGGQSWGESPLQILNTGDVDGAGVVWTGDPWAGISDPAVAWDDVGNVFLVGLMWASTPTPEDPYHYDFLGMAAYKSTDGGRTWSPPTVIHKGLDDKQWVAGDTNTGSPYHGNVYAVWDDLASGGLAFARTTTHGTNWIGMGAQPAGATITNEMADGEVNVANDGTVYIFGFGNDAGQAAIKFMKSPDGGQTFSTPKTVAAPIIVVPGQLPGGKFRLETLPTGCCGSGNHVVCAWPDYREGVARIYYSRSNNGGNSWQGSASGDPLLSGAVASAANQHDFMPQIVSTPNGEIGCAFYEFGPKGGGMTPLIDVVLAVSTDNGHTFPNRVTVTDQPWDPTVDEVYAHGVSSLTFIGDYFGLDASRLGFFPFWTDTRTGVQEIFTSRISVNPADIFIRDSGSDGGTVPSPGNHWEAPDLVVRWQSDGNTTFVDQGIQDPVLNNHYIYGKATNNGPNTAHNVTLAVTLGNWPQLAGLPGTEFRYPQDWYAGDWDSPGLQANRRFLGESDPIDIPGGQTKLLGPIIWYVADIPAHTGPTPWHPCLLAEVRADNNDSAGGSNGCDIDADPDPCAYGSYFWGNNNACQRNLSYVPVMSAKAQRILFPFIVGSPWSKARFLEIVIEKGRELAEVPMMLRVEPVSLPDHPPKQPCLPGELVFLDKCEVTVRVGSYIVGEIIAAPGTVWRPSSPPSTHKDESCHGAQKVGQEWRLVKPVTAVGFPISQGELRRMTLSFATPTTLQPGSRPLVRISQRNDRKVITGGVQLELQVAKSEFASEEESRTTRKPRQSKKKSRRSK